MPSRVPPSRPPAWRVLVAGGGPIGLTVALALARGLGPAVSAAVLDPALRTRRSDPRAYALSPGAVAMYRALGLWDELAGGAEPISGMAITDSRVEDAVRPVYLRFGEDEEPLAQMVEAERLEEALRAACGEGGVELASGRVTGFDAGPGAVIVRTEDGGERRASLLLACDGARSRLRELAGIGWVGRDYGQAGIVATVAHELPHDGRAIQHFLPAGPFAILPLAGTAEHPNRASIVWSEEERRVRALLGRGREAIARELELRFGPELGRVELLTEVHAFPLSVGIARTYIGPRFALVGDAAHRVHPLAGQGLNLGLGDAAAIAERVVDAVRLGLDPGGDAVLEAYQRDRRVDAVALAGATDALNRLFSNDRLPARVLRDIGLGMVDRAAGLKRFFAGQAAGTAARAPRLMRGEPL
ncbi:FAD-dependent monooxygenase [Enterovirga aerilata]|uniref:2-octaprenyl-6-methoxyphenyl hydroxylase n=1 Tax=Enterovirga aerilata TaxID=2730920 RepID=A0A849I063_9HYPH|nr:FAD-dependent monooxygenase [Enterovirga sp. DB1703]NNM70791.1 2-octaprenyl-6-methoxyphenyl hydroxylase [Enterovirga sp. DB1703]